MIAASPSDPMSAPGVRLLAAVGLAGVAVNAAVLVAAPFLRPDISVVWGALSQYAVGPWSWLQNVGFVALGVGSLAIACALALAGPISRLALPATLALVVAGLGCFGLAAFPMGEPSMTTPLGDLHQTAGTFAVGFHLTAMLVLLLAARADAKWRPMVWPGATLWAIALVNALLTQAELSSPDLPIPFGVVMRLVVGPVLLWWALVVVRVLRCPATDPSAPAMSAHG